MTIVILMQNNNNTIIIIILEVLVVVVVRANNNFNIYQLLFFVYIVVIITNRLVNILVLNIMFQYYYQANTYPDFITVDGAEGGTGAAPPEFSNSVGMPLVEGLTFVNNVLIGTNIRHEIKIICAGRVSSAFNIVRNIALGADVCNAARAMMFALGCIQALKCNTNKCPTGQLLLKSHFIALFLTLPTLLSFTTSFTTGIATQDKDLMSGLDVTSKTIRVRNYQKKTVDSALDIIGAMGHESPREVTPRDIMKRVQATGKIATLGNSQCKQKGVFVYNNITVYY